MRKVLIIALNGLTRTARDKKALALLLLMPMILIAILGSALKGLMTGGKINPINVIVVNADKGRELMVPNAPSPVKFHFGDVLTNDVLGSDQVKEFLKTKVATDLDQAKNDVTGGKAAAVIYIAPTFTEDTLAARKPTVQVFADPGFPTSTSIVNQIVRGYTDTLTAELVANRNLPLQELAKRQTFAAPKVTNVISGNREVGAMQYYAAAMAVMFMVMTALARSKSILEGKQNGTLSRMLATPTSPATILAGQVLGSIVLILSQFIILMLGTHFIFGVDWGPWIPALLLGFSFSLAAAGIGTAAAGLLKDPAAADASIGVIGNIFGALSGGMFPLYSFPDTLKMVAKAIPNYWALQGFLDQMSGAGLSHLWLPVTVLALIGLATGTVGTWRLATK